MNSSTQPNVLRTIECKCGYKLLKVGVNGVRVDHDNREFSITSPKTGRTLVTSGGWNLELPKGIAMKIIASLSRPSRSAYFTPEELRRFAVVANMQAGRCMEPRASTFTKSSFTAPARMG